MRTSLTILLVFLAMCSYSQRPVKRDFLLVTESPKIDSLMNLVFRESKSNYHFFSMEITKLTHSYGLNICQLDTDGRSIVYPYHGSIVYPPGKSSIPKIVYFNYKGNTIFVENYGYLSELFNKTNRAKNFSFVWDQDTVPLNKKHLYEGTFDFFQGKFISVATLIYPDKPQKVKTDSL